MPMRASRVLRPGGLAIARGVAPAGSPQGRSRSPARSSPALHDELQAAALREARVVVQPRHLERADREHAGAPARRRPPCRTAGNASPRRSSRPRRPSRRRRRGREHRLAEREVDPDGRGPSSRRPPTVEPSARRTRRSTSRAEVVRDRRRCARRGRAAPRSGRGRSGRSRRSGSGRGTARPRRGSAGPSATGEAADAVDQHRDRVPAARPADPGGGALNVGPALRDLDPVGLGHRALLDAEGDRRGAADRLDVLGVRAARSPAAGSSRCGRPRAA